MYNTVVERHQLCTIEKISKEIPFYRNHRREKLWVSHKIPSVFLLSFLFALGAIEFPRDYQIIYHYFYVFLVVFVEVVLMCPKIFFCVFSSKEKIFLLKKCLHRQKCYFACTSSLEEDTPNQKSLNGLESP